MRRPPSFFFFASVQYSSVAELLAASWSVFGDLFLVSASFSASVSALAAALPSLHLLSPPSVRPARRNSSQFPSLLQRFIQAHSRLQVVLRAPPAPCFARRFLFRCHKSAPLPPSTPHTTFLSLSLVTPLRASYETLLLSNIQYSYVICPDLRPLLHHLVEMCQRADDAHTNARWCCCRGPKCPRKFVTAAI